MKKLILLFFIFTLTGCGDNSSSEEITNKYFYISASSSSSLLESELGQVKVLTQSGGEFSIEKVTPNSGLSVFISKIENGMIYFLAPNVKKDEQISFDIQAKDHQGNVELLTHNVLIQQREITSLTSMPKPNVFSNSNIKKHEKKEFDSTGVPVYIKDGVEYYYPVDIAMYSYDLYSHYTRFGTSETLDKFLTNARWLRDNCIYTDYGFCSYRAYFSIDAYKLTTDWTTAMGQGQAITSLIAAHYLTGDSSFAETAYDAVSAFLYPIELKGLTADFNGSAWYEEYGSEEMPAHVLNGFLFSLSGVKDFVDNYGENYGMRVFDIGVDSLVNNIHLFDFDFTSRYDYSPLNQLASTKGGPDIYHEIHIFQLAWLYSQSSRQEIKDAAHLFLQQDMAGILNMGSMDEKSKEIKNLSASHSIDSRNYGVDKLIDANWTWNKYWSSHKPQVELDIELNKDVLESGILSNIVLTATSINDLPKSFDLYQLSESGQYELVKEAINLDDHGIVKYEHEVGGYNSYTVLYSLSVPISNNNIKLKLYRANSGVTKLRELDVHYPRHSLMDEIIEIYNTK